MNIKDIFLDLDEYFPTDFKKSIIYLHHTAGSCFVGDTLIKLVDGSTVRIDSLEIDKEYWLYGCDKNGDIKIINGIQKKFLPSNLLICLLITQVNLKWQSWIKNYIFLFLIVLTKLEFGV